MKRVKDELSKRLLSLTPKPYQTRAQSLFHFLESKLSLNDKGEIEDSDGSVIDGSNIADLIQHAVRDRRRNIVHVGWSHFLNILRNNNTPRMIMNYETLEELVEPQVKKEPTAFIATGLSSKPSLKRKYEPDIKRFKPNPNIKRLSRGRPVRSKKEPSHLKDYLVSRTKRGKYV